MRKVRELVDMLVRKLKIRGNAGRFRTVHVPATAALVLVTFAPSVAATAPQTVTPTTANLTVTEFAPVVTSGTTPITVTPTTRALALTRFAPTVTIPTPQLVTPTTRALTVTRYAPTAALSNALTVTPATKALTTTLRVPTVTASNKQRVVPITKALTITRFVPTISSPGSGPKLVTPTTKALAASRFAPTVTATAHRLLIPTKRTLTVTRYAPTVTESGTTTINVGAGNVGITVTSSNTTIDGYTIIGPGDNAFHANSRGISGSGAFSNITIRNCTITEFGYAGITLQGMSNVTIEDCTIEDVTYAGIMLLSVSGATVQRNTVRRVGVTAAHQQPDHNAYGIAITRLTSAYPPCEDIDVLRNVVEDVPLWHGIDAHGGNRLLVDHNTCRRTARAFWMGYMPGGTQGAGGGGCEDSTYSYNLATEPQSQLVCPFGHTYGGTDANTAISSFDSLDCSIIGNVVSTAYPNIHYDDVGNPSVGLTVSGNVRGTTLPP